MPHLFFLFLYKSKKYHTPSQQHIHTRWCGKNYDMPSCNYVWNTGESPRQRKVVKSKQWNRFTNIKTSNILYLLQVLLLLTSYCGSEMYVWTLTSVNCRCSLLGLMRWRSPITGRDHGPGGKFFGFLFLQILDNSRKTNRNITVLPLSIHSKPTTLNTVILNVCSLIYRLVA